MSTAQPSLLHRAVKPQQAAVDLPAVARYDALAHQAGPSGTPEQIITALLEEQFRPSKTFKVRSLARGRCTPQPQCVHEFGKRMRGGAAGNMCNPLPLAVSTPGSNCILSEFYLASKSCFINCGRMWNAKWRGDKLTMLLVPASGLDKGSQNSLRVPLLLLQLTNILYRYLFRATCVAAAPCQRGGLLQGTSCTGLRGISPPARAATCPLAAAPRRR